MSNKNKGDGPGGGKRTYRKRKRARQEEETRERITEAVLELHRTVGPARTTISEVAERAGVGRQTVYNHFPTEADLIDACSTHWIALNPLPDPEQWKAIDDPDTRLDTALRELYRWYERSEDMMGKVLRDAPIVEPLGVIMDERWFSVLASITEVLAEGRGQARSDDRSRRLKAVARLAIDFSSWRILRDAGLSSDDAAAAAADMVRAQD